MSYELRDHTADVAVAATGPTLAAVFAAAGDGMAGAMCDEIPADAGERFDFEVTAENREALLFDYLDRLIYERDVRAVLPVDNEVEIRGDGEEFVVTGSARGVPLADVSAREIKAVTYSDMELVETDDGWRAYVVLDV
ncbi:archease [Halorussus gelatinilyticus]|uniref:Archease n=1 Tax=Halorussus gelatinilyticus TaxID=2937524 RepID=A0A8U0IJ64_9EURY|nr:archease [Halorussus gelatinilyticus]UPW00726.1 archease [Halorussus gelatinilyticus]